MMNLLTPPKAPAMPENLDMPKQVFDFTVDLVHIVSNPDLYQERIAELKKLYADIKDFQESVDKEGEELFARSKELDQREVLIQQRLAEADQRLGHAAEREVLINARDTACRDAEAALLQAKGEHQAKTKQDMQALQDTRDQIAQESTAVAAQRTKLELMSAELDKRSSALDEREQKLLAMENAHIERVEQLKRIVG